MEQIKVERWTEANGDDGAEMWSNENGAYVLFSDHQAALARAEEAHKQYSALMELACHDIVFFSNNTDDGSVAFCVLVNDVFCPAADAERIDISEAIPLRDIYREKGYEGMVRYVQEKRGGLKLRPRVEKSVVENEDLRTRLTNSQRELVQLREQLSASMCAMTREVRRLRGDLFEVRNVVTAENFAEMQQRAEQAEEQLSGLRGALEEAILIIDGYYQGVCCCSDRYACEFCKEADSFMQRTRNAATPSRAREPQERDSGIMNHHDTCSYWLNGLCDRDCCTTLKAREQETGK